MEAQGGKGKDYILKWRYEFWKDDDRRGTAGAQGRVFLCGCK